MRKPPFGGFVEEHFVESLADRRLEHCRRLRRGLSLRRAFVLLRGIIPFNRTGEKKVPRIYQQRT